MAKKKEAHVTEVSENQPAVIGGKSHLITEMLNTYIRGSEEGENIPRAAKIVESLYNLATRAENESTRLAAQKEILDRVDGKVVERKEIRSMKIEGIVYLPEADNLPAVECKIEA
jgi:hypothetical protein